MNKKLLAAAVVAAMAASPVAFADSTVYGKMHTSIDYDDRDQPDGMGGTDSMKNYNVRSRASRLGFKGSEDLGNGLKAIYQIEFGISSDGGNQQNNTTATNRRTPVNNHRNTFVGLSGDWGTALVGRHDTPMKMAFYAAGNERLGDSIIDLNSGVLGVFQEVRANNAIAYVSPNFSGFTVAAAIIPGEQSGISTQTQIVLPTTTVTIGNKNDLDNIADHYSLGAMYKGNGLKASVGYEVLDEGTGLAVADKMKTWQVGASYTMNAFSIGGAYQNTDNFGQIKDVDYTAYAATGKWTAGNNAVSLVYTHSKMDNILPGGQDTKTDGWGISGEHNLSKRSKVYAAYAYNKTKDIAVNQKDLKDNVFSLGMIHNF